MPYIDVAIENGIAVLGIDRPQALNALNRDLVDELDASIDAISKDESIRVLVLYSKQNFAAGADIKNMVDMSEAEAKAFAFSGTFNKIEDLPIPTIAAVEGYALGGGLELALACDMRIAAPDAKLGFPETGLGIMPGAGGTARAARLTGPAKAMELILLGTIIGAEEAHKIGLVNQVSESGGLLELALKWAGRLAKGAPVALRTAKQTVRQGLLEADVKRAIEIEGDNWAALFNTEDQKEGMKAFIEKRKPAYQGK
ncbi:MAG: enoyl-CoA hydratase/isomerase family protein [Anaerovoracaceae bacterium]